MDPKEKWTMLMQWGPLRLGPALQRQRMVFFCPLFWFDRRSCVYKQDVIFTTLAAPFHLQHTNRHKRRRRLC